MFGVDLESVVVQPNQPLHWRVFLCEGPEGQLDKAKVWDLNKSNY